MSRVWPGPLGGRAVCKQSGKGVRSNKCLSCGRVFAPSLPNGGPGPLHIWPDLSGSMAFFPQNYFVIDFREGEERERE